ncbi:MULTISPECIES: hypothetical protein [Pectobacterium]|uniref:hypothetical protein n=1 Tax=Pectobacterium TaxID=122277 RepID=UPI00208946B4|nr:MULTISPECIES: hypothetical protein [Pectobacterium]GKV88202.1 hypothetical protein PEC301619_01840 [Pectobacterium carotovorum subsp. carotovorum]GKX39570.1 hypothetical protein SOASR014_33090 [Pectobacterium carotovorum subsp. carotovorum]GLX45700.1 hypothetical protein Pcaca01_33680 [Pectobacterium carotovorum subsp. carotovorum]
MAKTTKSELVGDLNARGAGEDSLSVEDLNAGGNAPTNQQHDDKDDTDSSGDDDTKGDEDEEVEEADLPDPEFVVMKGNSIRHNGEVYRENTRIPVSGNDAERLLAAGVIADVQVLRQRVLSAAPAVSVTTE